MKNRIFLLALSLMLAFSTIVNAAPDSRKLRYEKVAAMTTEQKEARMVEMKQRVEQIKAMDKSKLTRNDRKALKQELRSMNKEARAISSGGIYISLGALIIIVLLLLLL